MWFFKKSEKSKYMESKIIKDKLDNYKLTRDMSSARDLFITYVAEIRSMEKNDPRECDYIGDAVAIAIFIAKNSPTDLPESVLVDLDECLNSRYQQNELVKKIVDTYQKTIKNMIGTMSDFQKKFKPAGQELLKREKNLADLCAQLEKNKQKSKEKMQKIVDERSSDVN